MIFNLDLIERVITRGVPQLRAITVPDNRKTDIHMRDKAIDPAVNFQSDLL